MRIMLLTTVFLLILSPMTSFASPLEVLNCPNPERIVEANEDDVVELKQAIEQIIPSIYGTKSEYLDCEIEKIKPLVEMTGEETIYYDVALLIFVMKLLQICLGMSI